MFNYHSKNNPYHLYKVHYTDEKGLTRIIRDDFREETIPTIVFNSQYYVSEFGYEEWKYLLVWGLKQNVCSEMANLLRNCCLKIGKSQRNLREVIERGRYDQLKYSRMYNLELEKNKKVELWLQQMNLG